MQEFFCFDILVCVGKDIAKGFVGGRLDYGVVSIQLKIVVKINLSNTPSNTPATLSKALCTKGFRGVQKTVVIHPVIHL